MKDGIYHVRFSSNMQGVGEGLAVFKGEGVQWRRLRLHVFRI